MSFSFKAGKMRAIPAGPNRFKVEADERKGKLTLEKNNNDGSIHLKWADRYTLAVEDDLLIFPGDQKFTKVDTGREKDRVYLLQFSSSSRRMFFWMQEPDASKDSENCQKLNDFMQNPSLIGLDLSSVDRNDPTQQTLLQLIQSLGNDVPRPGNAGNAPAAGGNAGGAARGAVQIGDLSNILASISSNANNNQQQSTTQTGASGSMITPESLQNALQGVAQISQRTPPLHEIIRSQDITPLLNDPAVQEALLPLLPENMRTPEELRSTFSSPQFRQALVALSQAIQSEGYEAVMASMALNPSAGAEHLMRGDGIGAFLAAVMARYPSSSSQQQQQGSDASQKSSESQKDKKNDDDENFYE